MAGSPNVNRRILGYWNVRGIIQPIRFLLEYAGLQYEEKRYPFDMCDPSDREKIIGAWLQDKQTNPMIVGGLGEEKMEFPNLPYYLEYRDDGTVFKMTQSLAIMAHLARVSGLNVEGGEDKIAKADMYTQTMADMARAFGKFCYAVPGSAEASVEGFISQQRTVLQTWERLFTGQQWILGDKLTYVDFIFFEVIDSLLLVEGDALKSFDNLIAFHQRFRSLSPIKAYLESDRCIKWPLKSPFAKTFGYYR